MKYQLDFSVKPSTVSPPSGTSPLLCGMAAETRPAASGLTPGEFIDVLKRIFEESILGEVSNLIGDITKSNGCLSFAATSSRYR